MAKIHLLVWLIKVVIEPCNCKISTIRLFDVNQFLAYSFSQFRQKVTLKPFVGKVNSPGEVVIEFQVNRVTMEKPWGL